jgi:hypothetical protein
MKIGACSGREDSREQTIHHFVIFPAFFNKFHGHFFTAASFYDAGINNRCPATTSASTMVETMKSSVRYVHQMAI